MGSNGKRTTKEELHERRKECLARALRGQKTTEWVREIAEKYDVAESTIWDDWRRRNDWIPEIYSHADVVDVAKESMVQLSQVKEEAWKTYYKAQEEGNVNGRIGALRVIQSTTVNEIEKLQSLGEMHKESEELDVGFKETLQEEDSEMIEGFLDSVTEEKLKKKQEQVEE